MYQLLKIDEKILADTITEWRKQIADSSGDLLATRYERILDWAQKHVDGNRDENTYVYALVHNNSPNVACALLDLSHAQPRSNAPWLKVLDITVEPRLDVNDTPDIATLSAIAAAAIVETLELTFKEHPSTQLKVYGDSPLTKDFLEGIAGAMAPKLNISVSGHRKWLVIDK